MIFTQHYLACLSHASYLIGDETTGRAVVGDPRRHHWQWWELLVRVEKPGMTAIRARATEQAGRTQPERPEWNRLGYGGNAIHLVNLRVV